MDIKKDIDWFKSKVAPTLTDYELKYKHFEKGDFGSLSQVEFNRKLVVGLIFGG
jgi:hypothetical protein